MHHHDIDTITISLSVYHSFTAPSPAPGAKMMTVTLCLSSTSSSSPNFPPFPPIAKLPNSFSNNQTNAAISRRQTSLLLSITPFLLQSPPPAVAFNLGISGPKDWLREQKKKSIKYLLAPIDASQEILRHAYQLLTKDVNYEQKDLEEIQGMLKSAARDCVAEDRNSLVAFQAKTGVEVCTFKLVVTNASSLLDDGDSAKLEAEARLSDLISSFTFLNGVAKEADLQLISDRQKVANAVMDSLSSLNNFEQGIKGCIEV